jgi:Tol biopolymer transport system component
LYEILTGKPAFDGASAASVIAAILERPAPSVSELAPPALDQVLRRCLEKDPDNRWQTARDLKAALALATSTAVLQSSANVASTRVRRPVLWMAATGIAVGIAALAVWAWQSQPLPQAAAPLRFAVEPPPDAEFTFSYFGLAISPDGRQLAFAALKKGAPTPMLWLRPMDSLDARELPGTENANGIFWSPDSKSIAFHADDKLKRIDLAGGSARTLCDAPGFEGGTWNSAGLILFGSSSGGLRSVPAAGGASTTVTTPSDGASASHRYPHFLPDGSKFLFTLTGTTDLKAAGVFVTSLDKPGEVVRLVDSDAKAAYAPARNGLPGYLLWLRDQTLMAQVFDIASNRLEGDSIPIADGIATGTAASGRRAAYSVSIEGLLVYRGGGFAGFQLAWVNRAGKAEIITGAGTAQRFGDASISRDGRRIILEQQTALNFDVWLYELSRGVMTRLTFDPGRDWFPVWSPDGEHIAYSAERAGVYGIYRKNASGAGQEDQLVGESKTPLIPNSWSPDGRHLLYVSNGDIFVLPIDRNVQDRKPVPYLQTPFRESHPQFSPDGKWVAYLSDESGRPEVYIRAFPLSDAKWQVSNVANESDQPRWSRDGKELFFVSPGRLWTAGIRRVSAGIEIDAPRPLFGVTRFPGPDYIYDAAPDGQRFLVIQVPGAANQEGSPITVVSDWQAGFKK